MFTRRWHGFVLFILLESSQSNQFLAKGFSFDLLPHYADRGRIKSIRILRINYSENQSQTNSTASECTIHNSIDSRLLWLSLVPGSACIRFYTISQRASSPALAWPSTPPSWCAPLAGGRPPSCPTWTRTGLNGFMEVSITSATTAWLNLPGKVRPWVSSPRWDFL